MSIRKELRRTAMIAVVTLASGALLELASEALFCTKGHRAARVARHESVVVDSGYRFAIAGESIFACTSAHRTGLLTLHDDFTCYCVPAGSDPRAVAERLHGQCTVDKIAPTRSDDEGICRHAHCEDIEQ